MEVTGSVIEKKETKTFKGNFRKREFIIDNGILDKPNPLIMYVIKGECDTLDYINVGDIVKVDFELLGRTWEGRTFVNLEVTNIEMIKAINKQEINNQLSFDDVVNLSGTTQQKNTDPDEDLPF